MSTILNNSKELKTLTFQTENKITYHIEKTPFPDKNPENLIKSINQKPLEILHHNDIWHTCNVSFKNDQSQANRMKIERYEDPNDEKVMKLMKKDYVLVTETPEIYDQMVKNVEIATLKASLVSEKDVFYRSISSFDVYFSQNYIECNRNPKNFTLKIIPDEIGPLKDLKIRDLNSSHIDYFQTLQLELFKLIETDLKNFANINKEMLQLLISKKLNQPIIIYCKNYNCENFGNESGVEDGISLEDVIFNLRMDSDYYKKVEITYRVDKNDNVILKYF